MKSEYWLVAGLLLLFIELFVPAGIVGALGFASLCVSLGIWMGWITTPGSAFVVWAVLVALSILVFRLFINRFYPSQSSVGSFEEDENLRGQTVEVVETIEPGGRGRVLILGTTWLACFKDTSVSATVGQKVILSERSNILWYVELVDPQNLNSKENVK